MQSIIFHSKLILAEKNTKNKSSQNISNVSLWHKLESAETPGWKMLLICGSDWLENYSWKKEKFSGQCVTNALHARKYVGIQCQSIFIEIWNSDSDSASKIMQNGVVRFRFYGSSLFHVSETVSRLCVTAESASHPSVCWWTTGQHSAV